jgi:hypothetical protein
MPVDAREEGSDMVVITVRGRMAPADQAALLYSVAKAVERAGKIRLLAVLRDFEGWTIGEDWADDALRLQSDAPIIKMAIVGEARWKDDVFAFIAKPFRNRPIEYFESEAAARSWLAA